MPGKPEWTDKWLAKLTLGNWYRAPGTEASRDLEVDRDRPERPLSHWARRHGLLVYVLLIFVLPAISYSVGITLDVRRLPLTAMTLGPSLVLAIALLKL